jgi:hypothetical protein
LRARGKRPDKCAEATFPLFNPIDPVKRVKPTRYDEQREQSHFT